MCRPCVARLVFVATLITCAAAHGQSAGRWATIPPASGVIVELTEGASVERLRRDVGDVAFAKGARMERLPSIRHQYSVVFHGAALSVDRSMLPEIAALPYVKSIHSDEAVEALAVHVRAADSIRRAVAVHGGNGGRGVTVAVIDSGIDYMHPALGGGFGAGFKVAGGYDFINGDADPRDDNGHGTHVAGVIAAEGDSMTGLAPGVTLLAFKVLDASGSGHQSDVIAALERAVDPNGDGDPSDHADVANLSLGGAGTPDDPQSMAVDAAVAAGVVVCVAAGNEGTSFGILSPGTARRAITVGALANDGHVAAFSSRGPCVRLASVKPDVVAPGVAIRSTIPGGGFAVRDGTSAAAPHVAAACALILAAHRGWTPGDVKSAIIMTATPIDAEVMARGGGVLDAAAAIDAPLVASESHFSFGLDAGQTGTWQRSQSIIVTNVAGSSQTYRVATTADEEGIAVEASPATLELAAGASRVITVSMSIDNDTVASAPPSYSLDGVVTLTGAGAPLHLPWAVVKASRAVLTSDQPQALFFILATPAPKQPLRIGDSAAELYVPAGDYELAVFAYDMRDGLPVNLVFISGRRTIAGDGVIQFTRTDAPLSVRLRGTDEQGMAISSGDAGKYLARFRIHAPSPATIAGFDLLSGDGVLATSALPPAFTIKAAEVAVDADRNRIVALQYPSLAGVEHDITLAATASDLKQQPIRIVNAGGPARRQLVIDSVVIDGDSGHDTSTAMAWLDTFGSSWSGDFYANEEAADGEPMAVVIESPEVVTSPLRVRNGRFVSSWALHPSPLLRDSASGEEVTYGDGPVLVIPRVIASTSSLHASMRIAGAAGESLPHAIDGGVMTVYDRDGAFVGGRQAASIDLQLPRPGPQRIIFVTPSLCTGGRPMRASASVKIDSTSSDATPPLLTSIAIVDDDAGALLFTAADYDPDGAYQPIRGETARAWFRWPGSDDWLPLTVVQMNDDSAIAEVPLGIQYRAGLAAAFAHPGAAVDLRISITDGSGNEMMLTLEPAFFAASNPARRRPSSFR